MAKWTDIGPSKDFPPGSQQSLRIDNIPVVIFNVEGMYLAIADVCPHAGMPLGQGELCGKRITCPFHGYSYNIEDGKNTDFPNDEPPVRTFPARVSEAGVVQLDLELTRA